jgi:hypothetical protein
LGVIRHQIPRENSDADAIQLFGHEIEVCPSIAVSLENGNRPHAMLRNVMRVTKRYNPGNSRHVQTLVEPNASGQEKLVLCPRSFDHE